jgi:general secretion pathway protein I
MCNPNRIKSGFTLIEVLLALLVLSIGLTCLLTSNAQSIRFTNRLKEKTFAHQIAMSTLTAIQLNHIALPLNQETTRVTHQFGSTWYWRAHISPTPLRTMQQISISISTRKTGPFTNRLIGYRYVP